MLLVPVVIDAVAEDTEKATYTVNEQFKDGWDDLYQQDQADDVAGLWVSYGRMDRRKEVPTPSALSRGVRSSVSDAGVAAASTTASQAEWQDIACQSEFSWSCSWVLATISCESTNNPRAHGVEWINGKKYEFWGLLQIWDGHRWTPEQLMDPEINIRAGYELYLRDGVRSWPNCP